MAGVKRLDLDPVAVVRGLAPERVLSEVSAGGRLHVVQEDGISFESELAASRAMLANPASFLDHPVETILGLASGGRPDLYHTSDTGENKAGALDKVERYFSRLQGSRTIKDDALMIADELFTNGSKSGLRLTSDPKSKEVVLQGKVEIIAHAREDRVALVCRDTYGKLDVSRVLGRMRLCFDKGIAEAIHHGIGGAGIGSFMVFSGCASYYAGVDKDRVSVVAVVLPLGLTRDEVSNLPKNIHLLSK